MSKGGGCFVFPPSFLVSEGVQNVTGFQQLVFMVAVWGKVINLPPKKTVDIARTISLNRIQKLSA